MRDLSRSDVIKPEVRGLTAYTLKHFSAEVKLDQNENPYELPAELKQAVVDRVLKRNWGRYPEFVPEGTIGTLSKFADWPAEGILVGNGSNELIQATLTVTLGRGRRVTIPQPTFTLYGLMSVALQADVHNVPMNAEDMTFNIDGLIAAARSADVVVICNPNNPTGTLLEREALEAVLREAAGLVLVDEAYHEFSEQTAVPLLNEHRNLVVLRTFSKAMAMAGLRFGYMLTHPDIAKEVNKGKLPYNVNIFTLTAAELVIEKRHMLQTAISTLIRERERVAAELKKRTAVQVFPSKANFLLIRTAMPARKLFEGLYVQGVLVRDVSAYPLLTNCLRVSIGTPGENDRFLTALDNAMETKG
jgi:histidinol-phosphate aminotransferase